MFFAAEEAFDLGSDAKITPVRQEQLKDRLGDHFHELDTPLLVMTVNVTSLNCANLMVSDRFNTMFKAFNFWTKWNEKELVGTSVCRLWTAFCVMTVKFTIRCFGHKPIRPSKH